MSEILYHATDRSNLASIASEGLRTSSYWTTNLDLATYYAEDIEDNDGESVILEMRLEQILALTESGSAVIHPDNPGIAEPISTVIGMSEGEVIEAWRATEGTWQDSLRIIGSLMVEGVIPPELVQVDDYGINRPLTEFREEPEGAPVI